VPDILPAPYGTLVSDNGGTLVVNAVTPLGPAPPLGTTANGTIAHALPPFDIVIGTERLTVTAVTSDDGSGGDLSDCADYSNCGGTQTQETETEIETWTVSRGVANTTPAAHAGGVLVMSTPLPILPLGTPAPYVAGTQALMCVADQFNEGNGHATTFLDLGDGHVGGP